MLEHPDKRDEYSFSMLILSNIITVSFSAILLMLYPWLGGLLGLDIPLVVLMCVLFLFQPAYNIFIAKERYELEYKKVLIGTAVSVIISPLAAIGGILLARNRLYGQIFGAQGALILIYSAFYIYLAKKSGYRVQTKYWKAALLFNAPIIPHYLSQYLLNHSDRLMISKIVGDSAAGYYSVAYSVAMVPTILWSAVNDALVPYTYEKCEKGDYSSISKLLMSVLTAFSLVCVIIIMLAPEIVSLMATSDYLEAIYVIPPIVGGVFFQVQYNMCANIIYYHKKPQYVMIASVTATVLNIALNYLLIPRFGYIAAGYTTLVSYIVQAVIDYVAMGRVVKRHVYDLRYLLILSSFAILIALTANLLYNFAWIRYIILLAVLAVCCALWKKGVAMYCQLKKVGNQKSNDMRGE